MSRATFFLLLAGVVAAEPVAYKLAPADGARFALEVHKTGLMSGRTHLFLFDRYRGELRYDRGRPEDSRVRLVIESASADLQDTWVSEKDHRKIQDFALKEMLAAEKYPEIAFVSEQVRPKSEREFQVVGTLTIRGIAKPVTVEVVMSPETGGRLWFEGKAMVNMKNYGLKPPKAALGLIGTEEEMEVSFRLAAVPQ